MHVNLYTHGFNCRCSDDPGRRDNEIPQRTKVTRLLLELLIETGRMVAVTTPGTAVAYDVL